MKKKFFIVFISLALLFSLSWNFVLADYPQPTGNFFVNDFANIIDTSTKNTLQATAIELQNRTGAQAVIVTVKSLDDKSIEEYALGLFRQWGIGQKDKNNGVLILISSGDRKSRIEVGYGLEGALPDSKTGRIQDDYMIPRFIEEDYSTGIANGYYAILKEIYAEYGIDDYSFGNITQGGNNSEYPEPDQTFLIIIGIILLLADWIFNRGRITRALFIMALLGRGGRGGRGGGFGGGGGRSGGGGSSRGW